MNFYEILSQTSAVENIQDKGFRRLMVRHYTILIEITLKHCLIRYLWKLLIEGILDECLGQSLLH
jgi:hypothetical protein